MVYVNRKPALEHRPNTPTKGSKLAEGVTTATVPAAAEVKSFLFFKSIALIPMSLASHLTCMV